MFTMSSSIRFFSGVVALRKFSRIMDKTMLSSSSALLQSGWVCDGPGDAAGVGGGGGEPAESC